MPVTLVHTDDTPVAPTIVRVRPKGVVNFVFDEVEKDVLRDVVVKNHYSGTCPGLVYAYGIYEDCSLVGVVGYSKPSSHTLCDGVCGKQYSKLVIELSRLVILTKTNNAASYLIGQSLQVLPDRVVVSYADCNNNVGHVGYVYQATNWLYTGEGSPEPIWTHPVTGDVVSYHRRHVAEKAAAVGLMWQDLVQVQRVGKHRYVCFTGSKRFKKTARKCLKYPVYKYPKGDTRRHHEVALKDRLD